MGPPPPPLRTYGPEFAGMLLYALPVALVGVAHSPAYVYRRLVLGATIYHCIVEKTNVLHPSPLGDHGTILPVSFVITDRKRRAYQ